MIAHLRGILHERGVGECVVDVAGVGYRVMISGNTASALPAVGAALSLRIRTVVREDALDLYGFQDADEEQLFLLLTGVSGVGPRLALTVLSGLPTSELTEAIARQDTARLVKIHGVGKKTAERLVLELRDRVAVSPAASGKSSAASSGRSARSDLVSALLNLGYREAQAESAARLVVEAHPGGDLEHWVREALVRLRGQGGA